MADNFVNYAMETAYYVYGQLLKEAGAESVNFSVLREYGWVDDYYTLDINAHFIGTYTAADGTSYTKENDYKVENSAGSLKFTFDAEGQIADIDGDFQLFSGDYSIYQGLKASQNQYSNNAMVYYEEDGYEDPTENPNHISASELNPKRFTMEIELDEDSEFVTTVWYGQNDISRSLHWLYYETGAYYIVLFLVILVFLAALLLPFIKCLDTGREKIFSLPFEISLAVGILGCFATAGMSYLMAYINTWNLELFFSDGLPNLLGYEISIPVLYQTLRWGSLLGWAILFFIIYMTGAAIRQILAGPVEYIKTKVLFVRLLMWMKKQAVKLYQYLTKVELNEKMHGNILKIVAINFCILALLCCMWFLGVAGLLLYSAAFYVICRKEGEKLQRQYQSILGATKQMAGGDLKISLDEDLGPFASIGASLEQVQQGFSQAVAEEARSQSMKTELITNVSHDLKTPLTAIITYIDLLKKEDITEEERKAYIETLDQKSQRLKSLIEDLFEVSKAQSGNVKMNFMNVDVVSLLKQIRTEMNEQIENSTLQFRWNLPEEKVILSLDGQRTYRIFKNLLNNILKYAMSNSRAYIDLTEKEGKVEILFRNVSASELSFEADHLTERFVRGDSARNTEGSGLGLAIAKSFTELQNGIFDISVDGDLFKVKITFFR